MANSMEELGQELRESNQVMGDVRENTELSASYLNLVVDTLSERLNGLFDVIRSDNSEVSNQTSNTTNQSLTQVETNTEQTNGYLESVVDIFSTKLDELVSFMRGDRLDDLERRREQSLALSGPSPSGDREKKEDKGLLGKGFENLTGGLIADAKALLAPIMSIIGMVVKGGILALVVGGLFLLFKTIKDNPVFLKTVESLKDIWENSIVPTFNDIRKSVMNFIESPAFDRIVEVMDTLRTAFQTLFLRQLETLVNTLSDVFDGLADVITGILEFDLSQIYTGLNKVTGSIISGVVSTIDNIITAVLEVFGISFEGDATLFEAITRGVKNIFQSIKEGILSVFTGVSNWVSSQLGFSEGQMPSMIDIVTGIVTAPIDLIGSVASWIAGKLGFDQVSDLLSSFSFSGLVNDIFNAPVNLLRSAKNWILNKLGFDGESMPSVTDIIMSIVQAPFDVLRAVRDFISEKVTGLASAAASLLPDFVKNLLGIDKQETDDNGGESAGVTNKVGDTVGSAVSGTAGFIGSLFNNDDETEVQSGSTPLRVAAGNELQQEGEAQRDAEREALGRVGGPGSNAVNVATNVQNNSNTTVQQRPSASSQPDNLSDSMMSLGFAP